jgi:hypothetical protein
MFARSFFNTGAKHEMTHPATLFASSSIKSNPCPESDDEGGPKGYVQSLRPLARSHGAGGQALNFDLEVTNGRPDALELTAIRLTVLDQGAVALVSIQLAQAVLA